MKSEEDIEEEIQNMLSKIIKSYIDNQIELSPEVKEILYKNLWDLYS